MPAAAVAGVTELERIETVAGQVPLPGMSDLRPRPAHVRRPDGRTYRPRRLPHADLTGVDGEIEGVAVMHTHNVRLAEQLARQALDAYDPVTCWRVEVVRLSWGIWRPDRSTGGSTWIEDGSGLTGTPAVFLDVEAR